MTLILTVETSQGVSAWKHSDDKLRLAVGFAYADLGKEDATRVRDYLDKFIRGDEGADAPKNEAATHAEHL